MTARHDAFKVHRVRSSGGESAKRQMVASFVRYIEAEIFIHAELLGYSNRGTDAGTFWGSDDEGGHIHFWIQSPHLTDPVRVNSGSDRSLARSPPPG
jgi:hypothetical protein